MQPGADLIGRILSHFQARMLIGSTVNIDCFYLNVSYFNSGLEAPADTFFLSYYSCFMLLLFAPAVLLFR